MRRPPQKFVVVADRTFRDGRAFCRRHDLRLSRWLSELILVASRRAEGKPPPHGSRRLRRYVADIFTATADEAFEALLETYGRGVRPRPQDASKTMTRHHPTGWSPKTRYGGF